MSGLLSRKAHDRHNSSRDPRSWRWPLGLRGSPTGIRAREPLSHLAVELLLFDGPNVLMQLRAGTGFLDGYWGLPSGHMEPGETVHQALTREAQEEVGITPVLPYVILTMHRIDPPWTYVNFYLHAGGWEGQLHNAEPHRCAELSWWPRAALPPNTIPHVAVALAAIAERRSFVQW